MSTHVKLIRTVSTDKGTYGNFILNGKPLCVTLELPWKENQRNISCIPMGEYKCKKYSSAKYPDVWEITNVKDRTYILIHIGNFLRDTSGCILVGTSFSEVGISSSVLALKKLRKLLPDEFTLEIHNALF